jgi:hypothetical protein
MFLSHQDLLTQFSGEENEPDVIVVSTKSASSSAKRVSPTKDDDDMNVPLKMLRKNIKVEKM